MQWFGIWRVFPLSPTPDCVHDLACEQREQKSGTCPGVLGVDAGRGVESDGEVPFPSAANDQWSWFRLCAAASFSGWAQALISHSGAPSLQILVAQIVPL